MVGIIPGGKSSAGGIEQASNAATSGTNAVTGVTLAADPSADSTQVLIAHRVEINYSSTSDMLTGGYLVSGQDVLNTAGSGTHDKLVGRMVQMNLTGGNVAAAVGAEAVFSQIGASTIVAGAAGFLFANHRSVPNIGNVGLLAAFSNQDPVAVIVSAGPFKNSDLREISPSNHIGLIAGRYYSAPARAMAANTAVAANVIYVTYVQVPERDVITRLGLEVTGTPSGNCRLSLYKVANGALTTLVVQSGSISTGTIGVKEEIVNVQVDSGVYALAAVFSGTPTIRWHEINGNAMMGAMSPSGFSEQAYISPFPFGAFPATANIVPTFNPELKEPHLWYRVGV